MPLHTRKQARRQLPAHVALLSLCLTGAACEPLYGPDFGDTPLVQFRASAQSTAGGKVADDTEAVIFWTECSRGSCSSIDGGIVGGGGGLNVGDEAAHCLELPACNDYLEYAGDADLGSMMCREFHACIAEHGQGDSFVQFEIFHTLDQFKNGYASHPVEVTGSFPSAFEIDLYEIPEDSAELWEMRFSMASRPSNDGDQPSVALGLIVAKGPGQIRFDSRRGFRGDVRGGSEQHIVLYTRAAIARASDLGLMLNLRHTLDPGFHIMEFHHHTCDNGVDSVFEGSMGRCGSWVEPAPKGNATLLEVRIDDPEKLAWPLTDLSWLDD